LKNKIIILLLIIFVLSSCEHVTPPIKKVPYCPPPVEIYPGEWKMPHPYQNYQRASYDGKNLIFRCNGKAYLLNLKTGIVSYFDMQSKLPNNVRLSGVVEFFWCPYDNNRVLIHAVTSTDLPDDSIKRYYYGQNLYIVSIDGSEFKRVTPSIYGPAGIPGNFNVYSWLPKSEPGRDLIQITANVPGFNSINLIYIPQTDEFSYAESGILLAISKDGKNYLSYGSYLPNSFAINGNIFQFNEEIMVDYYSFSPCGKYLALSVWPNNQGPSEEERRYNEIWLINVEKFLSKKPDIVTPDRIINLRHDFCMYAMVASPCAEFISETELAVAMYKDGDDKAYLWKVGIDGKLLGQLTFEP
jgi:hypothetical protein